MNVAEQVGGWILTVAAPAEIVQDCFRPLASGLLQSIDDAVVGGAPVLGCAKERPRLAHHHAAVWIVSVTTAGRAEGVEHLFGVFVRGLRINQLPNSASAIRAAKCGRAVKVSRRVADDIDIVHPASIAVVVSEAMKQSFSPSAFRRLKPVNGAVANRASDGSCSIQVSQTVEREAAVRIGTVTRTAEAMDHLFSQSLGCLA